MIYFKPFEPFSLERKNSCFIQSKKAINNAFSNEAVFYFTKKRWHKPNGRGRRLVQRGLEMVQETHKWLGREDVCPGGYFSLLFIFLMFNNLYIIIYIYIFLVGYFC